MSLVREWTVSIGMFVQAQVPTSKKDADRAYGRVCAIETYTDDICTRKWVYVRWIYDDGRPSHEPMKHAIDELEPFEE